MEFHQGIGYEKACRLSNTSHSEIAPALSLPLLPVCFGDDDRRFALSDDAAELGEVVDQAGAIAALLRNCDVSYLKLKQEARSGLERSGEGSRLYNEVLECDPQAFDCSSAGDLHEWNLHNQIAEKKLFEQNASSTGKTQRDSREATIDHQDLNMVDDPTASTTSRKPKYKKKENEFVILSAQPDVPDHQDISNFCDTVEDFCGRAEMLDAMEGRDGLSLPLTDVKLLLNEIISARTRKILQLIPVDTLVRLLNVLDHQVRCGQGLSIDNEDSDIDATPIVLSALECTYAALAVLAHRDMPKQIYKEEIIEQILDFSRHQIMDSLAAFSPLSRTHKQTEYSNLDGEGEDDDDDDNDINTSAIAKKRRNNRSVGVKRPTRNKVSSAVHSVIQKLCSILGFLTDLLSVERLTDSCILQLVKTSFSTFLVDNMHLLQMKSINLICGVFASYKQHRSFLIDETVQLLKKLQFSKRALRAYHLPEEEHKQIQMVTALLIQLVQFSANIPEFMKTSLTLNTILEASIDASYLIKSHESAKDTCCLFWTSVLQRFTNAKALDVSECKVILENLVMDLLTTLNLPEFPASALILEVLCVLLLQNVGLKSKDTAARCMAIDLLGTIAATLKRDALICSRDRFWILQELGDDNSDGVNNAKDACSICHKVKGVNIACHVCLRCFHPDCLGLAGQETLQRDWLCHLCACNRQLKVLQSYCQLRSKDNETKVTHASNIPDTTNSTNQLEVVQQILLNYLNEAGLEDHSSLLTCWFYLCLWFKDDPQSEEKIFYYLARVKPKAILRDSGSNLLLSRNWTKKICLALGQHSSFFRGFDTILSLLLATMKENSPVLRAKALRAVSLIVEADPEVLCDIRVQSAVEGRFCDSAISVREASLELVGRHIASHPDVGLKYFEKVAERIKDTGVSVRKRAVKIIRDLCTSNSNFSQVTSAFIEIISRVTDEESSIQDLVCKTFYEFWFEEPSGSQTQFASDGSSVPMEVATKTEQIVDMLRRLPSHHLLVTIIKRNLALDFLPQSVKASGINAATLSSVRKRCELICKRLLERILQVEERNSDEEEVRALPYVLALHAFCVVDPMLCAPATDPSKFIVTLQPYLKHQVNSKSIAQLLESIIFVIDAVLPLLRKPPPNVIEELQQDFKIMIMRHSFLTVVHACIRCLCSLSKIAGKGGSLVENLILFFFKKLDAPGHDNKQLLVRSLFCLGLLLRYGNGLMDGCNSQYPYTAKCLLLLKRYLLMEDLGIKVRALQALGYLLIARPEYMLEKEIGKIIEASLSSTSDSLLKMQVLQNIYEYLLDAESQLDSDGKRKNATGYPENSTNSVPVAAGAGDTNICGGIIQLYWNSILERCLDVSDQVRHSALKIVEIVLRQGLVHPITCVPCLVALETDPLEVNSKLAHHLLINMNEKYPAFFENRLGDGLQLAFRLMQSIIHYKLSGNDKGKSDGNMLAYIRPGISRIYRLIRGNRNSRNKFMHSIVRKFESGFCIYSSIPFLLYCTEILASLPFTCPDEPLYLIYDINRVIQLRAGGLEANMKMWSSLSQHQDSISVPAVSHGLENNFEAHQNTENNLRTQVKADGSYGISDGDLQKFQADCHEAIALELLLKLKRHLKIVYSLNDSRCQAFSLKENPKSGETVSRQNISFNITSTPIRLPTSYQDMVQKYQEFKAMLREDTMDYAIYTATVKRKRPTPRTSRGAKAAAKAKGYGSDDDDDDDEDWTGGPRKLDFGGQKPNGGRVTRQRVQV